MSSVAEVDFVAAMKTLKDVLGDNDLAKQVFADANALDRQNRHDHFEARLEYVKQVAQLSADAQKSTEEQGLQTLKWLFLLNAGAIALVLTFAGSKAPEVKALLTGALIKPIALFVMGCVFVVGAGAAGFFNFFHAMGSLPSAKALHQFVDPTKKAWPLARMQSEGETQDSAYVTLRRSIVHFGLASFAPCSQVWPFVLVRSGQFGLCCCTFERQIGALVRMNSKS